MITIPIHVSDKMTIIIVTLLLNILSNYFTFILKEIIKMIL